MQLIDPFPGHYAKNDPFGNTAGRRYGHTGSDWNGSNAGFGGLNGKPIPAIGNGTVVAVGFNSGNGNYLCMRLEDGHYAAYLHMQGNANFSVGQNVAIGATVGRVGGTGKNAIGAHLHITVSDNAQAFLGLGNKIDPWAFIQANLGGTSSVAETSKSSDVANRQNFLNAAFGEKLAVDSIVGPATTAAIVRYQNVLGVTADGQWGPITQAAHQARENAKVAAAAPAPSSRASVSRGSTGQNVTDLQARLNRDYSLYSKLAVDGQFGPGTEAVVKEFQRRAGLVVDGVAGPATYGKLGL